MKALDSHNGASTVTRPRVLLADSTGWPEAARLAIGLSGAGSDVSALSPSRRHAVGKTRCVRKIFPYSGLRPLYSLVAAITAAEPQLIIPCDDRAVQHLHELHAKALRLGTAGNNLAALIEKSLGSPQGYPMACARHELLTTAREEGLRVPDTIPINSAHDLKSWQMRHSFPCVLKADATFGGHGVRIAHTPKQAEEFFWELTRYYRGARAIKRLCVNRDAFWLRPWWNGTKPGIIAQSYINGRPANCAVVCWRGKVLAGIGVEVVSLAGPTDPASVVKLVDSPDMMRFAERIAGRLGLSGFIGLDFMIESGTGLTYLIEMNPRPTRISHVQLGKGSDLIGAIYAQLSGQPLREAPPITQKKMIAYSSDSLDSKNEHLESSFHDFPEGEPDLAREILRPWPTKSFLWQLVNQVERMRTLWRTSKSKRGCESDE